MNSKKIFMIIDDDPDDRLFFREAISQLHPYNECHEAEGGHIALDHLRAASTLPDFIFLDLNMPKMNGKEFLLELKKDEKLSAMPVIIYSSSTYQADIDETKRLGASHFLPKAFNISKLPEEIAKAVKIVSGNEQN